MINLHLLESYTTVAITFSLIPLLRASPLHFICCLLVLPTTFTFSQIISHVSSAAAQLSLCGQSWMAANALSMFEMCKTLI